MLCPVAATRARWLFSRGEGILFIFARKSKYENQSYIQNRNMKMSRIFNILKLKKKKKLVYIWLGHRAGYRASIVRLSKQAWVLL